MLAGNRGAQTCVRPNRQSDEVFETNLAGKPCHESAPSLGVLAASFRASSSLGARPRRSLFGRAQGSGKRAGCSPARSRRTSMLRVRLEKTARIVSDVFPAHFFLPKPRPRFMPSSKLASQTETGRSDFFAKLPGGARREPYTSFLLGRRRAARGGRQAFELSSGKENAKQNRKTFFTRPRALDRDRGFSAGNSKPARAADSVDSSHRAHDFRARIQGL